MLLWWAIEDKAVSDRDLVLRLMGGDWSAPITQKFIVDRVARRFMVEGDYAASVTLLNAAHGNENEQLVLQGWDKALEGRKLDKFRSRSWAR
jgi:hypothetical protein